MMQNVALDFPTVKNKLMQIFNSQTTTTVSHHCRKEAGELGGERARKRERETGTRQLLEGPSSDW